MPAPLDPRWPHAARLNPLERPDRRWRRDAKATDLDHARPGGGGQRP